MQTNNEYRNTKELCSDQGVLIDEGSLWILKTKEKRMVLVDDDQYITTEINLSNFKKQ